MYGPTFAVKSPGPGVNVSVIEPLVLIINWKSADDGSLISTSNCRLPPLLVKSEYKVSPLLTGYE